MCVEESGATGKGIRHVWVETKGMHVAPPPDMTKETEGPYSTEAGGLEDYDALVDMLNERVKEGVISEEYAVAILRKLKSRPLGQSISDFKREALAFQ